MKAWKLETIEEELELINLRFFRNMNGACRNSISRFKKLIALGNETRKEAEGKKRWIESASTQWRIKPSRLYPVNITRRI